MLSCCVGVVVAVAVLVVLVVDVAFLGESVMSVDAVAISPTSRGLVFSSSSRDCMSPCSKYKK